MRLMMTIMFMMELLHHDVSSLHSKTPPPLQQPQLKVTLLQPPACQVDPLPRDRDTAVVFLEQKILK